MSHEAPPLWAVANIPVSAAGLSLICGSLPGEPAGQSAWGCGRLLSPPSPFET